MPTYQPISRWFLGAAGALLAVAVVAYHVESVTEFSPDSLKFRGGLGLCGKCLFLTEEWSAPLLDQVREKFPPDETIQRPRWNCVHSWAWRARHPAQGEAKPAYRLFRLKAYNHLINAPG